MKYDKYEVNFGENLMFYEFESDGPRGKVTKLIHYTEMELKGFYNLGFGDKDHKTGDIDDTIITNDGDSVVKRYLRQWLIRFIPLQINILRHGFT